MSDAGDFVDLSLQREASWSRAAEAKDRLGGGLRFYGASVGAVRGTVRDVLRRHRELVHDDITALSSELWAEPVFDRRLAAVVLLQSNVHLLTNTDLTRIEGFVRQGRLRELVDPLAVGQRRAGNGDWDGFARRARLMAATNTVAIVTEAVSFVNNEMAKYAAG